MQSNPNAEHTLELSQEAQDDIRDILQYTFDTYGKSQLLSYKTKIDQALQRLQKNPGLGHKRPDLPPEYDAYLVEQHVLIFRLETRKIFIVRVLHGRMDFTRALDGN